MQLTALERLAQWEAKLPAVLRGELKPTAAELVDLAEYCAGFERNFVLASRFAGDALAAVPPLYHSTLVVRFAGWAVRASRGEGADAADLTALQRSGLRRQALAWLREAKARGEGKSFSLVPMLQYSRDLAPLRNPEELAKLPPEERIAWEKFWLQFPAFGPSIKTSPRELAPPPREAKRENDPLVP